MKQLITCLFAICLMSVVHAQTGTVTASAPPAVLTIAQADEMLTLKETEFDFGKIPQVVAPKNPITNDELQQRLRAQ